MTTRNDADRATGEVQLESLGQPAAIPATVTASLTDQPDAPRLRLRCVGVPIAVRQRLSAIRVAVIDGDTDEDVDAWVISTRASADELAAFELELPDAAVPTVVLAHTGAERTAVRLVSAGADAIVGEGNEEALLGLTESDRTPNALLASFERRFGGGGTTRAAGRGLDAGTGLPDGRAFERRIGAIGDADEVPRVLLSSVLSDRWARSVTDPVVVVQRRRLATMLAHAAGAVGVEIFATGPARFGFVGTHVSPHAAERLGERLVALAGTLRDRGVPLRLVVGHAGPEAANDRSELLELADRALEVAAVDGVRTVLGAADLAEGVSVTTELEAVVRLLDRIEPSLPEGRGHGERVGRIAAELARLRGWVPPAVARAQLAGHLHDVGRGSLPPAAIGGPADLDEELLAVWRTFPSRSAELLRLTAGEPAADTVRHQLERWDGTGFPEGQAGADIPEGARLLAVAHAIDELVSREALAAPTLEQRLRDRAGTELDPDLADLASRNLAVLLGARSS